MLSDSLTLGNRWTFVGGKGGVGKTTVAAALAIELADAGEKVLVLSVDPAHSLGDALGFNLGAEPGRVPDAGLLEALEANADRERQRFFDDHGAALALLIERGTYLDAADVEQAEDLTMPGMDEVAALWLLGRIEADFRGRVIIDTAPTGHTLRLLELPKAAKRWLGALDAMERKHAALASALTGSYAPDAVGAFLARARSDIERVEALLVDHAATTFVLVTTAEPVVMTETQAYLRQLEDMGVAVGGIVLNRADSATTPPDPGVQVTSVPILEAEPVGVQGLRRFSRRTGRGGPESTDSNTAGTAVVVGETYLPPADRRLYIVAGKGGVGKSTVASALAIALVDSGRSPVLLLSVDPAGSLTEILGSAVGSDSAPLPSLPGLHTRQLDASAAWESYRQRYLGEIAELFERLLPAGVSASFDRAVLEHLIDLSPAGVDELVALMEVIDLTEDRVYDAVVLDTAPTGHLMRLLELPDAALEWSHAMLRLLLKYRAAIPLGGLAERVLRLAHDLRNLRHLLRDADDCYFLAVALPESLSIPETRRLVAGLHRMGMTPDALLVNRALRSPNGLSAALIPNVTCLLAIDGGSIHGAAPIALPPPVGIRALREFARGWRRLHFKSYDRSES